MIGLVCLIFATYFTLAAGYHMICRLILKKAAQQLKDKSLMVVFGSGGHTTEMLHMLSELKPERYRNVVFIVGHTDTWSLTKLESFLTTTQLKQVTIERLFRAREVKQSYLTSIGTTLIGLLDSLRLILIYRPDLVVTNGPGTAVPLCYASFIVQKCLLVKPTSKLLFIESFCRVKTLSLSGKLLKPIVDKFVVQWPDLADGSKVEYLGKNKFV